MSGGSYDYAGNKLRDLAEKICSNTLDMEESRYKRLRLAFSDMLYRAEDAMHAIECHDSGDWRAEQAEEALVEFCGFIFVSPDVVADAEAFRRLRSILR